MRFSNGKCDPQSWKPIKPYLSVNREEISLVFKPYSNLTSHKTTWTGCWNDQNTVKGFGPQSMTYLCAWWPRQCQPSHHITHHMHFPAVPQKLGCTLEKAKSCGPSLPGVRARGLPGNSGLPEKHAKPAFLNLRLRQSSALPGSSLTFNLHTLPPSCSPSPWPIPSSQEVVLPPTLGALHMLFPSLFHSPPTGKFIFQILTLISLSPPKEMLLIYALWALSTDQVLYFFCDDWINLPPSPIGIIIKTNITGMFTMCQTLEELHNIHSFILLA